MADSHRSIKRIDHTPHRPNACMNCGLINLEDGIAITNVSQTKTGALESRPNVYCPDCETLMIIVNYQPLNLRIQPSLGFTITLRNSN